VDLPKLIGFNDRGQWLFTTQTLGLNPEILENTKLRAIK
jgi:hypothetical protein